MEHFYEIRPGYPVPGCDAIVSAPPADRVNAAFELHFNQNEEPFLRLPSPFAVPSFPVHHDIRDPHPGPRYAQALRELLSQLVPLLPAAFRALAQLFDPADTLHPGFYRVYKAEESLYLYLFRLDLGYRPAVHEAIKAGSNDATAAYRSRDLFFESEFIPLASVERDGLSPPSFRIDEALSQTWIGETGKGYMTRGIWMDADLSKFFTKLFLPEGKSLYPYYPLFCKYKTLCCQPLLLEGEGRKKVLASFHRQSRFLRPWIEAAAKALKREGFSETMPEFAELRRKVPASLLEAWTGVSVRAYLNRADQKEYLIEI